MFALGPSERSSGQVARPLVDRGDCAAYAAMGYWFYHWDWGEGIAFEGLDAWSRASGKPQFSAFVTDSLDAWMEATGDKPSRFGPAVCLLTRASGSEGERYLEFARRVGDGLLAAPDRNGAILLDAPSSSIFVDSLCSDPPFLLRLARATGDERYAVRAREIALGHCRILQDPKTGLFGHFADVATGTAPGIAWGRGNGWAIVGLSSYLAACDPTSPERGEIANRFTRLCEGLAQHRIPGGGWRNLIDREESYPEMSSTVLIAHALAEALEEGSLSEEWRELADTAWSTVAHRIDTAGHLVSVSYRPGINTDPSRYEHAPAMGGGYPWAQGPYLLAAAGRLRTGLK